MNCRMLFYEEKYDMNIYKSRYQYSRFDNVEIKKLISHLLDIFNGDKIDYDDTTSRSYWIVSDEVYSYANQREFLIEIIDYDKIQYSWKENNEENNLVNSFPNIKGYYTDFKIDGDPVDCNYKEIFKKFVKLGSLKYINKEI